MSADTRTIAGAVLRCIQAETRRGSLRPVLGSFIEGEKDTASVWMTLETDGNVRYFQVHVTELHPTEQDLDFYRRGGNQ